MQADRRLSTSCCYCDRACVFRISWFSLLGGCCNWFSSSVYGLLSLLGIFWFLPISALLVRFKILSPWTNVKGYSGSLRCTICVYSKLWGLVWVSVYWLANTLANDFKLISEFKCSWKFAVFCMWNESIQCHNTSTLGFNYKNKCLVIWQYLYFF